MTNVNGPIAYGLWVQVLPRYVRRANAQAFKSCMNILKSEQIVHLKYMQKSMQSIR